MEIWDTCHHPILWTEIKMVPFFVVDGRLNNETSHWMHWCPSLSHLSPGPSAADLLTSNAKKGVDEAGLVKLLSDDLSVPSLWFEITSGLNYRWKSKQQTCFLASGNQELISFNRLSAPRPGIAWMSLGLSLRCRHRWTGFLGHET